VGKAIFITSGILLLYVYLGYPAAVALLAMLRPRRVLRNDSLPGVSILIAAHNEEGAIGETIANKLALDYPPDRLQIIAVSDGSTDATDAVIRSFAKSGVLYLRQEPRAGKTSALNMAVKEAEGEILVFSDANSIYDKKALRALVRNFADGEVGYVTGKMVYVNPDGGTVGDGCSAYMRYENFLRSKETLVHSVVGVDGGVDAVRKSLYRPMAPDQLPDFVLPLMVVEQGYRVVYEPEAVLEERVLETAGDEYRMRVRVALRALWALRDMRHLFDITKYGIFSWQLFSHKALRYGAWLFLAGLYLSNLALLGEGTAFAAAFIAQNLFYAAAVLSMVMEKAGHGSGVLYIPGYFSILNVSAAHAFARFLLGRRQVLWAPRKG